MKINKYQFVAAMLFTLTIVCVCLTGIYSKYAKPGSATRLQAVTSFYPMYIAAKNVIGSCEGIALSNLSEPQAGCMHDYQLTPNDMRKLSQADVFIVNGGGIENFLSDVAAQYPGLTLIKACGELELLDGNAHAWMGIPEYMAQVQAIADGLSALDPAHRKEYMENCKNYLEKLGKLQARQQQAAFSYAGQDIVIFHEAFGYVARDFGLSVCGSMDLDEERQVSAGEAADIVRKVRENGVKIILAEELYGKEMCRTVQKEADVQAVYLDTCMRGDYGADSYLKAMGHNIALMEKALKQGSGKE